MLIIPGHIKEIMAPLSENGHVVYVVGGCVRDSLLGIEPEDWDIATSALPETVMEVFNLGGVGQPPGLQYGVVTVRGVQVASFRRESGYTDHRRPDTVEFVTDPAIDLARRDFTINAMAADTDGRVIDLFFGQRDLQNGLIRCAGDPERRFFEDALRILRALRFASVLDFTIEEHTRAALLKHAYTLKYLTKKVARQEIEKLRAGKGAERVMREFGELISTLNTL